MTSRGRKFSQSPGGDSSPKGRAKASYIVTRNGAYLYRYAPFTVLRLPLNARAARKSESRMPLPVGEVAERSERRGQITATSNRKMLAPSQADDVPRAQGSLSHSGDSSPKGESQGIVYWPRNGAYHRYAPFSFTERARKSDGRKNVQSLWERWPSAARTERANNGNVQSENAGTFAGR